MLSILELCVCVWFHLVQMASPDSEHSVCVLPSSSGSVYINDLPPHPSLLPPSLPLLIQPTLKLTPR